MKKIILILIVFLGAANFSPAQENAESVELSLNEALAVALRGNPDVLLKAEEVKKAKLEINESRGELLPAVTLKADHTITRGLYAKNLGQSTTQATLKQYLYKGGKIVNTIKKNEYSLQAAQAELDVQRLQTAFDVTKAFYTLILAIAYSELNEAIVKNMDGHYKFLNERYSNGQASESEIINVKASQGNAQYIYQESLNQVASTQALLANLLHLEPQTQVVPIGELSYSPQEIAYTKAYLEAMKENPLIRQYEAEIAVDKRNVEAAKSDARPSIYASWDYYSRSRTSLTFMPSKGWQDYNILGLTVSWPVFDGWITRAKVQQALVDLKESQINKDKARRDIALELKQAYLSARSAIAKIEASKSDLMIYKDSISITKDKYDKGIVSQLDLDDALLKYDVAAFNNKEALYDYIIADTAFLKATGGNLL